MLLDIGLGILTSILLSRFFDVALTPAFLWAGILFSLLPDADFLLAFKKSGTRKAHEHRGILHYPLFFVPAGMIVISLFDWRWSILFGTTTFLHFLHDSIGIGWGVRWLYPFRKNYYAFLYQYRGPHGGLPQKLFYSWEQEAVDALADRYGDANWFKNIYLKFHPYAVFELIVFIIALVTLLLVTQSVL